MSRKLTTVFLAMLVLTGAMGLKAIVTTSDSSVVMANGPAPLPMPRPALSLNGPAPLPMPRPALSLNGPAPLPMPRPALTN
jgi:hypothetical protein